MVLQLETDHFLIIDTACLAIQDELGVRRVVVVDRSESGTRDDRQELAGLLIDHWSTNPQLVDVRTSDECNLGCLRLNNLYKPLSCIGLPEYLNIAVEHIDPWVNMHSQDEVASVIQLRL